MIFIHLSVFFLVVMKYVSAAFPYYIFSCFTRSRSGLVETAGHTVTTISNNRVADSDSSIYYAPGNNSRYSWVSEPSPIPVTTTIVSASTSTSAPASNAHLNSVNEIAKLDFSKQEGLNIFELRRLKGKVWSDEYTEDPKKICEERLPASHRGYKLRILYSDSFEHLDWIPGRLNIELNDDYVIIKAKYDPEN